MGGLNVISLDGAMDCIREIDQLNQHPKVRKMILECYECMSINRLMQNMELGFSYEAALSHWQQDLNIAESL